MPPPRRPAPELSPAKLVAAALAIIDESGLASLTMKRLAARLGCSPMAAYKHVADKDELVILAADALVGRYVAGGPSGRVDWEEQVRRRVRRSLALRVDHPWASEALLRAYEGREADTPNVGASRAALERDLRAAGFGPRRVRLAQALIETTITGLTVTAAYRARGLWRGPADPGVRAPLRGEPSERAHQQFAIEALLEALRGLLAEEKRAAAGAR